MGCFHDESPLPVQISSHKAVLHFSSAERDCGSCALLSQGTRKGVPRLCCSAGIVPRERSLASHSPRTRALPQGALWSLKRLRSVHPGLEPKSQSLLPFVCDGKRDFQTEACVCRLKRTCELRDEVHSLCRVSDACGASQKEQALVFL